MPSEFEYAVTKLDQLEAGYSRLRRRVAWLTILVIVQGVLLLYVLLPVGRLGIPKYLEANWFVLVDDGGRVRGELCMDQGPRPRLRAADGQERLTVWVNHKGAANVILLDNHAPTGAGRSAVLYAYDDGTGLDLRDANGGQAAFIQSNKQPGLQVIDKPPPANSN